MSDDHSDVGASEEHEADPVDMTDDGEVELNLPREVVEEQVRPCEEIRKPLGPLIWVRLPYVRRNDIGLSPQMGPGLNCPTRTAPSEYSGAS